MTHDTSYRPLRANLISLTVLFLVGIVLTLGFAASTAQMPDQGKKKKVFADDDLKEGKVRGIWQVVTDFDQSQLDDPAVPVVVDAIKMSSGHSKYAGLMKIDEVGVKNRGPKAVKSLQLRWAFVAFNEPDGALLEGYTPLFDVKLEANASRRFDIPAIFFNREIKRLTKGGELHGDFYLRVGVQEVRFADGSLWQRRTPGGAVKSKYLNPTSSGRFPTLAALNPDAGRPPTIPALVPCNQKPRWLTSAFFFLNLQTALEGCTDDRACGFNDENKTALPYRIG